MSYKTGRGNVAKKSLRFHATVKMLSDYQSVAKCPVAAFRHEGNDPGVTIALTMDYCYDSLCILVISSAERPVQSQMVWIERPLRSMFVAISLRPCFSPFSSPSSRPFFFAYSNWLYVSLAVCILLMYFFLSSSSRLENFSSPKNRYAIYDELKFRHQFSFKPATSSSVSPVASQMV